jgi:hypothetical protein
VQDPQTHNNFKWLTFSVNVEEGKDPAAGSCSILGDPPEVCANGVDDDLDGLIDEEPDTDGDGISDCLDDDDDGDGYSDTHEDFIGTDSINACPEHIYDSAWPPDFDNSRGINISDVLALKPIFGSVAGLARYSQRGDLDASGGINISDVLALKPVFGSDCI